MEVCYTFSPGSLSIVTVISPTLWSPQTRGVSAPSLPMVTFSFISPDWMIGVQRCLSVWMTGCPQTLTLPVTYPLYMGLRPMLIFILLGSSIFRRHPYWRRCCFLSGWGVQSMVFYNHFVICSRYMWIKHRFSNNYIKDANYSSKFLGVVASCYFQLINTNNNRVGGGHVCLMKGSLPRLRTHDHSLPL